MEFQKITLPIPEEVQLLAQTIEKIEPNSALAGGYLSDLYMGTPYQDLDFFIQLPYRTTTEFFEELYKTTPLVSCIETQCYYQPENGIISVYKAQYNDYNVHFIFTLHGKEAVRYFDVRFREFYYSNGQAYASKDALEDIANHQLCIGLVHSPIVAMKRLFYFKDRYKFTIHPQFLTLVTDVFMVQGWDLSSLQNHLLEPKYEGFQEEIEAFFTPYLTHQETVSIPLRHFLETVSYGRISIARDEFHVVYFHQDSLEEQFTFFVSQEKTYQHIQEAIHRLKKAFLTQSIRMNANYPQLVHDLKKNLEDPHYFHTIFMSKLQHVCYRTNEYPDASYIAPLRAALTDFSSSVSLSTQIQDSFTICVSQTNVFNMQTVSVDDFLACRYVLIDIKQNESTLFTTIYDFKLNHYTASSIPSFLQPYLDQVIVELREKVSN